MKKFNNVPHERSSPERYGEEEKTWMIDSASDDVLCVCATEELRVREGEEIDVDYICWGLEILLSSIKYRWCNCCTAFFPIS